MCRLAKEYAIKFLQINRPNFELDNISDYLLSDDETILISLLAIIYRDLEGLPKALEIWLKLKQNYEKNYKLKTPNMAHRDLLTNIALAYKHLERWEDCLQAAEEGMDMSLNNHDMRTYSRHLHLKGWSLLKLGRKDEGQVMYKKFLMFAYVLDGYAAMKFETDKKEYLAEFGDKLDLSLAWD